MTPQFCLFLHPGDEGWLGASEAWREGGENAKPTLRGRPPPTVPASWGLPLHVQDPEAGRGGLGCEHRRAGGGLTERAQVAIGLPHHVPVQGPLRGPQTPPLLRGEVHGHVREAHGLGCPPLGPDLVRFPRGERGRGRRHRKCHPGGGPAPPLPAGVREASEIQNAPRPGSRVGARSGGRESRNGPSRVHGGG